MTWLTSKGSLSLENRSWTFSALDGLLYCLPKATADHLHLQDPYWLFFPSLAWQGCIIRFWQNDWQHGCAVLHLYRVKAIDDSGPWTVPAYPHPLQRGTSGMIKVWFLSSLVPLPQDKVGWLISNRLLCLSGAVSVDLEGCRQKEGVKLWAMLVSGYSRLCNSNLLPLGLWPALGWLLNRVTAPWLLIWKYW